MVASNAAGGDAECGPRDYNRGVEGVVTLFRPIGPREPQPVAGSGYHRWPPRLHAQPIFYPVTNEAWTSPR